MKKIAYLITGDDPAHLQKHTPYSRKKIQVLGWTLLLPAFLWFMTGTLLAQNLLDMGWGQSLLAGFIMGGLAFVMDRSIVMIEGNWLLYFFRFLLAVIVSILGSAMLDTVLFSNDIDYYMQQQLTVKADRVYADALAAAKPEIEAQRTNTQQAYLDWQARETIFQKEADGSGGSGRKGIERIAEAKRLQANVAYQEYLRLHRQFSVLDKMSKVTAQQRKDAVLRQDGKNAILVKFESLHAYLRDHGFAQILYWLVFGAMFFMEILVLLVKVFSRKSSYEIEVERLEKLRELHTRRLLDYHEDDTREQKRLGVKGQAAKALVWKQ
jgi:hypothetical protein